MTGRERMAEILRKNTFLSENLIEQVVRVLYGGGYRRQCDTAREILQTLSEEVEKEYIASHDEKDDLIFNHGDNTATNYLFGKTHALRGVKNLLNMLERKYEEDQNET